MKGISFNCFSAMGVLMLFMNLHNIANLNICNIDYCCVIGRISKSVAINLMQNINLSEKSGPI